MIYLERQTGIALAYFSRDKTEPSVPGSKTEILCHHADSKYRSSGGARPIGSLTNQSLSVAASTERGQDREMPELPGVGSASHRANKGTPQNPPRRLQGADQGKSFSDNCRQVLERPESRIVRSVGRGDAVVAGDCPEGRMLDGQAF